MTTVGKLSGWKEVSSSGKAKVDADWETGEVFVGFYMESKEFQGNFNEPAHYAYFVEADVDSKGNVTTDDSKVTFRAGAGLKQALKDLESGQLVQLTCEGEKRSKRGSFVAFSCQKDELRYGGSK